MFYGLWIQHNLWEPVLSQRRDLLEQPLDFYQPDVLPATQRVIHVWIIFVFQYLNQFTYLLRVTVRNWEWHSHFNKITEVAVYVNSLVLIFPDRQPCQPSWQDIINSSNRSVLENLCHCGYCILRWTDVFRRSCFWVFNDANEQWQCFCVTQFHNYFSQLCLLSMHNKLEGHSIA